MASESLEGTDIETGVGHHFTPPSPDPPSPPAQNVVDGSQPNFVRQRPTFREVPASNAAPVSSARPKGKEAAASPFVGAREVPAAQADNPAGTDLLNRDTLVRCLAAMIRSPEQTTPLTVGLFGDWGAGKTSVMRLLREELKSEEQTGQIVFADFNVWSYEHSDNLAAALAHEVKRGLIARLPISQRLALTYRYSVGRQGWRMLRALASAVVLILSLAGVGFAQGGELAQLFARGGLGTVAAGALAVFVTQVVSIARELFKHPLASQLSSYIALPEFEKHLGLAAGLREDLSTLCGLQLKNGARLVLFVDDLDRCSPASIVGSLDAVRLIMDQAGVVVVIGVDHRVALRAVGDHYSALADEARSKEEIARDYIGKIVQVPVRLRDPGAPEIKRFVQDGLFGAGKAAVAQPATPAARVPDSVMRETPEETELFSELATTLRMSNPRQLLRLRNSYRLLKGLQAGLEWESNASLRMLFWQERARSLPTGLFEATEAALLGGMPLPKELPQEVCSLVMMLPATSYPDLAAAVTQVVMPRSRRAPAELGASSVVRSHGADSSPSAAGST